MEGVKCILDTGVPVDVQDPVRQCMIINPRRACAARVTVVVLSFCLSVSLSVCLSVCMSVTTFSAATRNKTANK